ncbi:MAG TPA: hypothetical protein VGD75_22280 [Bradyrhizobium sp.]
MIPDPGSFAGWGFGFPLHRKTLYDGGGIIVAVEAKRQASSKE